MVMNRLGHAGFPDTVCGVVKQGVETRACQFSWWCDGRSDQVREEGEYTEAKEIARKAVRFVEDWIGNGHRDFHSATVSPGYDRRNPEDAEFLVDAGDPGFGGRRAQGRPVVKIRGLNKGPE